MGLILWLISLLVPGWILWTLGLHALAWPGGPGIAYLIGIAIYVAGAYLLWRADRAGKAKAG
jgi:hypothetical protein